MPLDFSALPMGTLTRPGQDDLPMGTLTRPGQDDLPVGTLGPPALVAPTPAVIPPSLPPENTLAAVLTPDPVPAPVAPAPAMVPPPPPVTTAAAPATLDVPTTPPVTVGPPSPLPPPTAAVSSEAPPLGDIFAPGPGTFPPQPAPPDPRFSTPGAPDLTTGMEGLPPARPWAITYPEPRTDPAPAYQMPPLMVQEPPNLTNDMVPQGGPFVPPTDIQSGVNAQQGGSAFERVIGATAEAYRNPNNDLITPYAMKWADAYGLGGDARAINMAAKALSAVFVGGVQEVFELAKDLGLPDQAARALAGVGESILADMGSRITPHIPREARPTIEQQQTFQRVGEMLHPERPGPGFTPEETGHPPQPGTYTPTALPRPEVPVRPEPAPVPEPQPVPVAPVPAEIPALPAPSAPRVPVPRVPSPSLPTIPLPEPGPAQPIAVDEPPQTGPVSTAPTSVTGGADTVPVISQPETPATGTLPQPSTSVIPPPDDGTNLATGGTQSPATVGQAGVSGVQQGTGEVVPGGGGDQGAGAADNQRAGQAAGAVQPQVSGTAATDVTATKRPVTADEYGVITGELNTARNALTRAERDPNTSPEKLDTLRQRVAAAQDAFANAETPPVKGSYVRPGMGPTGAEHAAAVEAHNQAIDARVHAEGSEPIPAPKEAGKVFAMANQRVMRGTDAAGNNWIGTGHVMVRGDTLARAATSTEKLKTSTSQTVPSDAVTKVTTPKSNVDYQPVTWDRRVNTPGGTGTPKGVDIVIGSLPDGTHVALQKPVYDALHAASGPDGTITAAKKGDTALYARNAQGEITGTGMPMRVNQAQARIWARGPKGGTAPVATRSKPPEVLSDRAEPTSEDQPELVPAEGEEISSEGDQAIAEGDQAIAEGETPGDLTPEDQAALDAADKQIEALTRTRDRLQAKPNPTRKDAVDLAQVEKQLKAKQLSRSRITTGRRRGGVKEPFRLIKPGEKRDFTDYKFNDGTSVYRQAFQDANYNPDVAVNKPIAWQVQVLSEQLRTKFGFKNVSLTPDASPKISRDAMLDIYRAGNDMMAGLGLPAEALSLHGKLELLVEPEGKRSYLGAYSPGTKTLHIAGGANSLGHEWVHAMDHELTTQLLANPQMQNLLSKHIRTGDATMTDTVQQAFANVINTMFYDEGALAAQRLKLEQAAQGTTKAAHDARRQLDLLNRGASQQRINPSKFRLSSAQYNPKQVGYYASVEEMIARVHEAYIADVLERAGINPRGMVMPDEAYTDITDRRLRMTYPKDDERVAIFKALDQLHDAIRASGMFGGPAAMYSKDFGISDPSGWGQIAPQPKVQHPLMRAIRAEVEAYRNLRQRLTRVGLTDPSKPDPGYLTWGVRAKDGFRYMTYSSHGMMNVIHDRAPTPRGKKAIQDLIDRLAPDPGSGRYTPEAFEERARQVARNNTRRMGNILQANGLEPESMTALEGAMLRHFLVTGETTFTDSSGSFAIPANMQRAGGAIRGLLDQEWRRNHDTGLDVGYARNGYFPRQYNYQAVFANPKGFTDAATKLHQTIFDNELGRPGDDPAKLLEKWLGLSKEERALAGAQTNAGMTALRRNITRQAEINAAIKAGANDPALPKELTKLESDAEALAKVHHDDIRDHIADLAATNWKNRIMVGNPTDFDTAGPSGNYLNARVLPPETDVIMRDFMHNDPMVAIPRYFEASARRTAFAEKFGNRGQEIDRLLKEAEDGGVHGEDLHLMRELIENVTGRTRMANSRGLAKVTTTVHALGSVALMPRAVWTAAAEPINAALATKNLRVGLKTFAYQFGQLMHTASSYERSEIADLLGITTSAMHDSIMLSRMNADYSDSPLISRGMSQYYRTTGLTQITNAQRRAITAAGHWYLTWLAKNFVSTGTNRFWANRRDDATRMFNELGVPAEYHQEFAEWMLSRDGFPSLDELRDNRGMGPIYGLALRRIADRSIQEPYKMDRPLLSEHVVLRLLTQLMTFSYSFAKNVLEPSYRRVEHAVSREYARNREGGSGKAYSGARAAGAGIASASHILAIAGVAILAGLLPTMLRQYLFANDQWTQHELDDTLDDYILGLTMQRSGMNGTLDPIIQIATNSRYEADVSSLIEGASMNWFLKNFQHVVAPMITTNDAKTNTAMNNATKGAYNLIGVPLAAMATTALGTIGGPITRAGAGILMEYLTAPGTAQSLADVAVGEKGTKLPKPGAGAGLEKLGGLDSLDSLGTLEGGAGGESDIKKGAGGTPIGVGLIDDVAAPGWKVLAPLLNAMPSWVKAAGVGAGLIWAASNYLEAGAPYREQAATGQ